MSEENQLIAPKIEIEVFGEKREVKFELRNFIVLKNTFNISENELLQGLIKGDLQMVVYAIWTSTLKFAPYTPEDPFKVESSVNFEKLLKSNLTDLKKLTNQVMQAMQEFLPKQDENSKKKPEETQSQDLKTTPMK